MLKRPILFCTLFMLSTTLTHAQPTSTVALPDYWPTQDWRTASPTDHGFDPAALDTIPAFVESNLPYLDSLLIIRHGYIVYESYYNDHDADTLHDIASVTKSWTSALVGIAQGQGHLTDLDATLPTLLPDYFSGDAHADKRDITLRHLLMMRSGIEYDDDTLNTGGYGSPEELLSRDLTALALDFPMAYAPGETWNYSTLDSQLISAIVQQATGQPLHELIGLTLFEPLGITEFEWLTSESGQTMGGGGLQITPRSMAKLGLLYLHNGLWDDEQIVPAEWVAQSLTPQAEAFYPPTDQNEIIEWYGYHWWLWKGEWFYGFRTFQANGYGGQQVMVFPELDMILVTTANLTDILPDAATEQERGIGELILDIIFPALTDVELNHDIHIAR
jgi:CubicO group peptidase (beta-lactamase class C family)